jgi:hypothetical protein
MNTRIKRIFFSMLAFAGMVTIISPAKAEGLPSDDGVTVSMTVTATVADGKRMPQLTGNDIAVKRGKEQLRVSGWTPAQGRNANLDLFVLIDDAAAPTLGSQLDDLRSFILAQPPTTLVGVGYMRNAGVEVAQDLTTDHLLAARAVRMPTGHAGAYGSPYLSVTDLMKRWPEHESRREVIVLSDGVDRMHRSLHERRGFTVNPDVDAAATVAHQTGTIVHSIYVPGARLTRRAYWPLTNGQAQMATLSEKTGGNSFYLGLQMPVSLKPYLDELQKVFANQYVLSFSAKPDKKPGLQSVKLSTDVAGVALAARQAVWVPAARN